MVTFVGTQNQEETLDEHEALKINDVENMYADINQLMVAMGQYKMPGEILTQTIGGKYAHFYAFEWLF